jgi:hypothetical protein
MSKRLILAEKANAFAIKWQKINIFYNQLPHSKSQLLSSYEVPTLMNLAFTLLHTGGEEGFCSRLLKDKDFSRDTIVEKRSVHTQTCCQTQF